MTEVVSSGESGRRFEILRGREVVLLLRGDIVVAVLWVGSNSSLIASSTSVAGSTSIPSFSSEANRTSNSRFNLII